MFWTVYILFYVCYEISKCYIYLGTLISNNNLIASGPFNDALMILSPVTSRILSLTICMLLASSIVGLGAPLLAFAILRGTELWMKRGWRGLNATDSNPCNS